MLLHLYLYRQRIFIPTVAQSEAGYYVEINPVRVLPISEMTLLEEVINEALERGNPRIPAIPRGEFLKPVVSAAANISRWATFTSSAKFWMILIDKKIEVIPTLRTAEGFEENAAKRKIFNINELGVAIASLMNDLETESDS